ncbi:Ldh family oxidoreductase [Chitinasiproducens palmae]|uniref:L-lactate dehydrogenase n=1 Tax=Chitinasiproducens palmae TaxID=1770053 RepID=A0A1H2PN79_9BURK|nr:Ldh family oxidoreductase [Chitinasiproducens palmae]SDV47238.1 L-lactate dehydrogenase [Chitinasiproducens palmae]
MIASNHNADITEEARFAHQDLLAFGKQALERRGMRAEQAEQVALRLLDADLLGHRSHGFWLLATYLERLEAGQIAVEGEVRVLNDSPAAFAWHANRLPGAWVMQRAIDTVRERARAQAMVCATIAECSHIGCLQSYLLPLVADNLLVMLSATNAGVASVAPFGGIDPVLTTNPLAFGIPTRGAPILVDQCTSLGSNTFFTAFAQRGESLPAQWLLDADGAPTDDPTVLSANPPGTVLPLGGIDFGYKGFGLGLAVEALTLALPGSGRRTRPDKFGQGVFLQVINPAMLGGLDAFLDETTWLADACHASRVRPGAPPVRLPGERALRLRQQQLVEGITLSADAVQRTAAWADKLGLAMPVEKKAEGHAAHAR